MCLGLTPGDAVWAVVSVTRTSRPLLPRRSASACPTVHVGAMRDGHDRDCVTRVIEQGDDPVGAAPSGPLTCQLKVQRLAHTPGIGRD